MDLDNPGRRVVYVGVRQASWGPSLHCEFASPHHASDDAQWLDPSPNIPDNVAAYVGRRPRASMSCSPLPVRRPINPADNSSGNRRCRGLGSIVSSPPTPAGPVGVLPLDISNRSYEIESPKSPDGLVAIDQEPNSMSRPIPAPFQSPATPPSLVGVRSENETPDFETVTSHGEQK